MNHVWDGLDHILFILGIGLIGRKYIENPLENWKDLTLMVTAFTAGHAVSIFLSYFGVVNLSPVIIEGGIALSIAWIGLENVGSQQGLYNLDLKKRMVTLAGFGVLHGLGFARKISELALPKSKEILYLFSFNLGVEAAQIVLKVGSIAILYIVARKISSERTINFTSVAIFIMGMMWFSVRVFPTVLGIK